MIRSTVAHVDLAALQANFRAIRQFVADPAFRTPSPESRIPNPESRAPSPESRVPSPQPPAPSPGILAVVKANAYGHGASRVAVALEQAGASMLACADIEEGIVLRQAGVRVPILVFGALSVSDLDGLFDYALTPTISTPGAARAVQAAAARRQTSVGYHLKIDTGMNRLGFRHENLPWTLPELLASANLRLEGVYTHFASADVPESPTFNQQRERFERAWRVVLNVIQDLEHSGAVSRAPNPESRIPVPDFRSPTPDPRSPIPNSQILRHASNSAALLRDARCWYDVVRPGLLLYGIVPPPLASTIPLQPVMSLTSRVVAVKGIRAGESVGYGGRFTAASPRTVAVVPAGYADGLDARLGGRGHVLIRGRRVPIVGAVSMDMITVDVSDLDVVQPGDEVVLLGRQGDESWQQIDAREMAAAIGTIPWEVVCRLGARVERHYL